MKKTVILLCCLAVACTSPVENYIVNDFARVVRVDNLGAEITAEADNLASELNALAAEANPEANEGRELLAKAKKLEQEINSRLISYKRTGDYNYIYNIANDGDRCDQMYEKANRLIQKTKPYETHKDKQIKAFKEAVFELPYYDYVEDDEVLEKVDSVDVNYVFNHLVGTPGNKVTLSEDEIRELAKAVIKNYFIDNPTPTIKAHKYQKADDFWYISLSNGAHYHLRAIKCDNGEYEYSYTPV